MVQSLMLSRLRSIAPASAVPTVWHHFSRRARAAASRQAFEECGCGTSSPMFIEVAAGPLDFIDPSRQEYSTELLLSRSAQ